MKSRNQSMDMTQGVIWKQLAYFALPLFLGNLCQQLYNTADSVIVGKFVGKDALAAVSSSGNLIFMMTGFFMGLFVGAGVIISRYFGAKCYDRLEAAVHTDLAFAMVCGVLLTLVGIFLTPQILVWMRTPEDVLPQSIQYFRLYFMGSLFMIVYNACMGILQAVGDSRSPLRYLIISSITNVTLDLIFVGALKWGVNGAAIATVVSQMVSAVLCFRKLMQADGPYRLVPKRIRFELPMLKQIMAQGIPSGVQNSIIAIANVVVQSNINKFGKMAVAGCGAYSTIEGFGFLPITCFALSMTTFISQNLGAGKKERINKILITCELLVFTVGLVMGNAAYFLGDRLLHIYSSDPEVIQYGLMRMQVICTVYFLCGMMDVLVGSLRGLNYSVLPMIVSLAGACGLRIVWIFTIFQWHRSLFVLYLSYPVTWLVTAIAHFICFIVVRKKIEKEK